MILYNRGDENREKGEANATSAWLANPLYMLGMLHFIVKEITCLVCLPCL